MFILVGGEDNSSIEPEPTNACFTLNIENNELKKISSMKTPRIAHSTCYLNCSNGGEWVFAIGGYDEEE
jgi:hypothetical protein